MASIIKRGTAWRALVRRKGYPSYCKTFPTKAQAERWAKRIEADLDDGIAPRAESVMGARLLVATVIDAYEEMREAAGRSIRDSSNEYYTLRKLKLELGKLDVMTLTPQTLLGYAQLRAEEGAGGYTISMDLTKLSTVIRYAGPYLKVQIPNVVVEARPLLNHLKLLSPGGVRERRPQDGELADVLSWLAENRGKVYADAVECAAESTLRRGEICTIRFEDLDEKKRLVLVRNRKDPRKKLGNDMWVPLMGKAWGIVQAQSRDDPFGRIFPVHPQTLSKYFRNACAALGIDNLRLHDMRHEGTSRLFEAGYQIPEVALVTGHKKWENLKKYTNLRPEDLHKGPALLRDSFELRKADDSREG
ncbi:tyrosine-type recombinase/integrase [Comamonas terrigena]|uniref:tyrosine-type recombinase/integrase n=1 Tax=Comamonas terrigena TaxID=32013 RepID=UPI00244A23F5|nr:tyrosine-type recombinase/integrase [Comamonas terrigena]MDH1499313.1 tyrosine-type recombinase/integrase [Comamonas terrigena]